MSGIMNKAKDAVDKVIHPEKHQSGASSTNAGPHDSNLANKGDPRVDSDRDGSRNMGATTGTSGYGSANTDTAGLGSGGSGYGSTNTGTTGLGSGGPGYGSTNTGTTGLGSGGSGYGNTDTGATGLGSGGPGYSSANTGTSALGSGSHGTPGTHGPLDHGSGITGLTGQGGATHSTSTAGPHDSNLANKFDSRVDSGVDGPRTVGGGTSHTGTGTSGLTGQHGQSGPAGTSGYPDATSVVGSGSAPNTAGPHKSDMMNKMDPRVDSNLDGSKTVGGDKTYT